MEPHLDPVMAGLVPAIHALPRLSKTWMPATGAGMTQEEDKNQVFLIPWNVRE